MGQRAGTTATGTATAIVKRRIGASAAEVFAAWLDPEGMREWMCPGPVKEARVELDARVGGRYRIDMIAGPDVFEHEGEYLEITPPRRLVFTWVSPATRGERSIVTIDLAERGSETDLVLTHERLPDEEAAKRHTEGWTTIVEKLAAFAAAPRR